MGSIASLGRRGFRLVGGAPHSDANFLNCDLAAMNPAPAYENLSRMERERTTRLVLQHANYKPP